MTSAEIKQKGESGGNHSDKKNLLATVNNSGGNNEKTSYAPYSEGKKKKPAEGMKPASVLSGGIIGTDPCGGRETERTISKK